MLSVDPMTVPAAALAEARQYLRAELTDEDALLARLIGASAELCEEFTGQRLLARSFVETIPAAGTWRRLTARPVRAIAGVEAVNADGTGLVLPGASYAIDIDAEATGWVRLTGPMEQGRMRVMYAAGLADAGDWTALPEALRQGVIRLAAHLFTERSGEGAARPPAAVSALWRPWRRLRLA